MASVSFKDVELSANARLGESAGCDVQRIVDSARTALSAIMTGTSRAVMEFVMPYLKERVVHGDALGQKTNDRVSPRRHAYRNRRDALDDLEGCLDSGEGWRRHPTSATRIHLYGRNRRCGLRTKASRCYAATAFSAITPSRCGIATRAPFPCWKAQLEFDRTAHDEENARTIR